MIGTEGYSPPEQYRGVAGRGAISMPWQPRCHLLTTATRAWSLL